MAEPQNEALAKNIFGRLSLGVVTLFGVPLGLYVGQSTLETRYDVRDATLEIKHLQDAVLSLRAEQDKIEAQIRALELKVVVMSPRGNDGVDR